MTMKTSETKTLALTDIFINIFLIMLQDFVTYLKYSYYEFKWQINRIFSHDKSTCGLTKRLHARLNMALLRNDLECLNNTLDLCKGSFEIAKINNLSISNLAKHNAYKEYARVFKYYNKKIIKPFYSPVDDMVAFISLNNIDGCRLVDDIFRDYYQNDIMFFCNMYSSVFQEVLKTDNPDMFNFFMGITQEIKGMARFDNKNKPNEYNPWDLLPNKLKFKTRYDHQHTKYLIVSRKPSHINLVTMILYKSKNIINHMIDNNLISVGDLDEALDIIEHECLMGQVYINVNNKTTYELDWLIAIIERLKIIQDIGTKSIKADKPIKKI